MLQMIKHCSVLLVSI